MENGFPRRTNGFPAGLRVLVVDDNEVCLRVLEKMLIKCSYEVTTCSLARDALEMLRKKKDGFDIIISDVNMPDMDGFKLLEHVGLEMDLPVIMMSADGETSRVMKGVQHGACDYLLKPVRMKELQNIWQHVVRKKIHKPKIGESYESNDDTDKVRNGLYELDDGQLITGGDLGSAKKRKDNENYEHDNQDTNDPSVAKKARVVWSVDLHQKFLDALNQIGFDSKIGPKKILDLMNVPWLKRENVASHLQKYRLYLSRLQKQNEPKASFCAAKQSDVPSKDTPASSDHHDSMEKQQNQAATCSFGYSSSVQDVCPEIHKDNLNTIFSFLPATKCEKALNGDIPYPQKLSGGSRTGLTNTFLSPELEVSYTSLNSEVQQQQSCGEEIPMLQFVQQPKEEQDVHGYTHLSLPSPPHQIQAECPLYASSVNPGTSFRETDQVESSEIHSSCVEYISGFVNNEHPTASAADLLSVQAQEDTSNPIVFGDKSITSMSPNMKNHNWDLHCVSLEFFEQNLNFVTESCKTLVSLEEDTQVYALQNYACFENFRLNNLEVLDFPGMELITELPSHLYDGLRLNSDYSYDLMEYS